MSNARKSMKITARLDQFSHCKTASAPGPYSRNGGHRENDGDDDAVNGDGLAEDN
jgi:hypothetical protein